MWNKMRSRLLLLASCLALAAIWQGPAGADPTVDSWESNAAAKPLAHPCVEVDRSLVVPIPADHRAGAVERLLTVPIAGLSESETETILDLGRNATMASASGRIKEAIAKLKEQKRLELDEKVGSWGPSFQQRLDALEALDTSGEQNKLNPYLVRAVAKNEFTGAFFVSVCGDTISITHGSLGRGPTPPTVWLPIVVFLDHAPKSVLATWGIAQ